MAVDSHHWAQSSRRRYGAEERRKISAETPWYRGPLSLICFDSCHEWPIAGQDLSPPMRTTFWRGLISVISQWHVKHKKFPDRQLPGVGNHLQCQSASFWGNFTHCPARSWSRSRLGPVKVARLSKAALTSNFDRPSFKKLRLIAAACGDTIAHFT